MDEASGSLSVVGTGIRAISQTSPEALARIRRADEIFFLAIDPLTSYWLQQLNPHAVSMHDLYEPGKDRIKTYQEMIERVMRSVRAGSDVCFVSYGHPGVFGFPMHEAVHAARSEGFDAEMIPAISSEDCLFADLGIDPGAFGCQSFEATDFLVRKRVFDPTSALVLWQAGVIAIVDYKQKREIWNADGLKVLLDFLIPHYSADHEAIAYQAARYAWCKPQIVRKTLSNLHAAALTAMFTLYIPPREPRVPDHQLIDRLGATIRA